MPKKYSKSKTAIVAADQSVSPDGLLNEAPIAYPLATATLIADQVYGNPNVVRARVVPGTARRTRERYTVCHLARTRLVQDYRRVQTTMDEFAHKDLSQIRQMSPSILDGVLRRLPTLPKQHALVFGNSVNLPATFRVRNADPLPASDDAKIVDLWFHETGRKAGITLSAAPADLIDEEEDDPPF